MSTFNPIQKKNTVVELPKPDDSILFFKTLKEKSEEYWVNITPDTYVYGFQIQANSKWRPGLSDAELEEFQKAIGIRFPQPLLNFYKTMNGLTKPGINLFGNSGHAPTFSPVFYSYPEDVSLIQELREWIFEANNIKEDDISAQGISNIFPIYHHRCLLTDVKGNPVLSMYGNDILYWADNLSKLLANEIFNNIAIGYDFESNPENHPISNFGWIG